MLCRLFSIASKLEHHKLGSKISCITHSSDIWPLQVQDKTDLLINKG